MSRFPSSLESFILLKRNVVMIAWRRVTANVAKSKLGLMIKLVEKNAGLTSFLFNFPDMLLKLRKVVPWRHSNES